MIRSKLLVPDYWYKNSRDVNVFLRLIDLVANSAKCDIDNFINILNPDKCRSDILPILSSYLGYDYCITETPNSNRVAMTNFRDIITNRGSKVGIETAIRTAIGMSSSHYEIDMNNKVSVLYRDTLYTCSECGEVSYDRIERCINCGSSELVESRASNINVTVDYPLYSSLLYYLVERARPAGTSCTVVNGNIISGGDTKNTIGITDYLNIIVNKYNNGRSEVDGTDSNVGFSEIYKSGYTYLVCNVCGKVIKEDPDPNSEYNINNINNITCPSCGFSNVFTARDDSDIKLLYKLYDSNRELSAAYNAISRGSTGNMKILDKVVGLIVRIKVVIDDDNTYYTTKLTGIVPYLKICKDDNGNTIESLLNEYTLNGILDSIYQGEDIIIGKDDDDPENIRYYIENREVSELNDTHQTIEIQTSRYYLNDYRLYCSYVNGVGSNDSVNDPYWDIGDNGADTDKLLDYTSGTLSTQLYELQPDRVIEQQQDRVIKLYRFRIGDSSRDVIDDYIVPDTVVYDNDRDYNISNYVEPSHSQEYIDSILSVDMDMHVCASCSKYIPKSMFNNVCPFCGGQIMEGLTEVSSSYNPTILQGSYILDLEFTKETTV